MSSRKIIEAARLLAKNSWMSGDGWRSVDDYDLDALKAALEEHDARWAEFRKIPITGGG
jgi:hypothetical protein